MGDYKEDCRRALEASRAIVDGRDLDKDFSQIMVSLEHAVTVVLLAVSKRNPRAAAVVLNESLVQGIEERLSLYLSKTSERL